MAFNFPDAPINGQQYTPAGGPTYQYDTAGNKWLVVGTGLSGMAAASTTEVLTGTETSKSVTPDSLAALWEKGTDVASAATVSLGEGGYFSITGTTTITDIDFTTPKDGRMAWLVFAWALTITHSATLVCPGAVDIQTAAGDRILVAQENGDTIRLLDVVRAEGIARGRRNRVINGDFSIDQYNNYGGITVTAGTGERLVADRWVVYPTIGAQLATLVESTATPAPFAGKSSLKLTVIADDVTIGAADYWTLKTTIEKDDYSDLLWGTANAKPVTLSFWVYCSITGTFAVSIANHDYTRTWIGSYTVNVINTWEKKIFTIPGDTAAGWIVGLNGLRLVFPIVVGSNNHGVAGWQTGVGKVGLAAAVNFLGATARRLSFMDIQLEAGSYNTEFDRLSFAAQLAQCQRYYERGQGQFSGYVTSGFGYWSAFSYKATKRVIPTLVFTNAYNVGFAATPGATTDTDTNGGFEMRTSNATADGGIFTTAWTASAEL